MRLVEIESAAEEGILVRNRCEAVNDFDNSDDDLDYVKTAPDQQRKGL